MNKESSVTVWNEAEVGRSSRILPRTIDGTEAEARVVPGIVENTFFLIVHGKKPFLNMAVRLVPLAYVVQPEFWGIEVLGNVSGIGLPAIGTYSEHLPLDGIRGKRGIEVIWSGGNSVQIDVP